MDVFGHYFGRSRTKKKVNQSLKIWKKNLFSRKLVCTTDSDIRDCVTGNVQMVAQARRDMSEFMKTLNNTIIPVFEKTTAEAIAHAEELKDRNKLTQ